MSIFIKGETGATLGPERVPISDMLITDAVLSWTSLSPDTLKWTAKTIDLDGAETIIPDVGQKVSLYDGDVRIFHGHVGDPKLKLYGVEVSVFGPWWWLEREEVASTINDEGGTPGVRPQVTFAAGSVSDSIESLITSAREDFGLPLRLGTVASSFSIPKQVYNLTSFASVVSELLDWLPDAVGWFDHGALHGEAQGGSASTIQLATSASATDDDYNGLEVENLATGEVRVIVDYVGSTRTATVTPDWTISPVATDAYVVEIEPSFNVTRRGGATAKTLTIGTDKIIDLEVSPASELQAAQVRLPYATVDGAGDVIWAEQTSGTAAPGKVWRVTVSGPEVVDFLPPGGAGGDEITIDVTYTSDVAGLTSALKKKVPGFTSLLSTWPEGGFNWQFRVTTFTTTRDLTSFQDGQIKTGGKSWSNPTLPTGKKFVFFAEGLEPPEWAVTDYGLTKYSVAQMRWIDGNTGGSTPALNIERRQALLQTLGASWYWYASSSTSDTVSSPESYLWVTKEFEAGEMDIWMIPTASIPGSGKLTRGAADGFDFLNPTTGLAANLLAASNWLPWRGRVVLQPDAVTPENLLSRKFSIAGHTTALASAGALPKSYRRDLANGTLTIELGAPDRKSNRTLVNRTQINPQAAVIAL